MDSTRYTALIRTRNSAQTLPKTLASLRAQSCAPSAYVIVDSGSTDATLALVPEGAVLHHYVGERFNYSEALNQGLDHVATDHVLIISAHTRLDNAHALGCALDLLAGDARIGAAYYCYENPAALQYRLIDASNFTGFNGLWNTCALIKTSLLQKRRFRPEVFAAEDQEWASWLFHSEGKAVARIAGAGLVNINPQKFSRQKLLDEYTAVALFTNRRLLGWSHLAGLACKVVRPTRRLALRERYFNLALLVRLLACHISRPELRSKR